MWTPLPGTVWCTKLLRISIHCYRYKDFNHRCKDGYILGKTKLNCPVSLPITATNSLPPTWDRFRQVKRQSNKEWQGKTARACIRSDTILIDGSWLLPTKRLFRSAANFDFHENRPKMADLKSLQKWSEIEQKYQILFSFSTDKDRRTDSRIRRKNTAQPRRESNPRFPAGLRKTLGSIPGGAALCFFRLIRLSVLLPLSVLKEKRIW